MITIGKAPYRISLLGGSSDLEWFVEKEGYGVSIGFSIDKYSYSVVNVLPNGTKKGILKYSSIERYSHIDEIVHPLIREALDYFNFTTPLEISTYGFAAGGSGIGGSSSFLLSLLVALIKIKEIDKDYYDLAQIASDIEINRLKSPIGRQDQYLCALGGLSCLKFQPNGKVSNIKLINEKNKVIRKAIENMYLIPSHMKRNADSVLKKFKNNSTVQSDIKSIREIANKFIISEETREYCLWENFHSAVSESWEIKRNLAHVMNDSLNEKYEFLKRNIPNNWIRLIGAGSGGYFLVSIKEDVKNPKNLISSLGLKEFIKPNISEQGLSSSEF